MVIYCGAFLGINNYLKEVFIKMPRGVRNDGQPRAKRSSKSPQDKLAAVIAEIEKTEAKLQELKEEKKNLENIMNEESFKKIKDLMISNNMSVDQVLEALKKTVEPKSEPQPEQPEE